MKLLKLYCILLLSFFVFGLRAAVLPDDPSLRAPGLTGYINGSEIILQWNPVCNYGPPISYTIQESLDDVSWNTVYTGPGGAGPGTIASVPATPELKSVPLVPTDPDICTILPSDAKSAVLFNRSAPTYYYRIQSCSDSVCGPYGMSVRVSLDPAVPSSIVLSKVSGNSYKVTWEKSEGASEYELQRKVDGESFSTIYSGYLLYKNELLATGLYQYRVRACTKRLSVNPRCSAYKWGNEFYVLVGVNIPAGMLHYVYDPSGRLRAVLDATN